MTCQKTLYATISLMLIAVVLSACVAPAAPAPAVAPEAADEGQAVITAWQDALNAGDIDTALSQLTEDATIEIVPPPPGMDGIFSGKEAIRAWWEPQVAGNAVSEVLSMEMDGDHWVIEETWVDDDMKALGIESLLFVIEGEMEGDKIKSYTATMSEDSFAEFVGAMTQAENMGAVRAYIEEFTNEGNESVADDVFSEDVVWHSPTSPKPIEGIESLKASIKETHIGIPDFRATIDDIFSAGDTVVVRGTTTGTHAGPLSGMPATNQSAEWTFIEVYHVQDGKIQEITEQFDALGFLQQIGIMPADRESYTWGEAMEVTGAEPGDAEANKATVLGAGQAGMAADTLEQLDEMFAADFVNHDPSRPQVTDLESFKAWSAENVTGFPDQKLVSEELVAAGDKVMERWTWTGTESQTGTPLSMTGTTIYRFEEGKIAEAWWANNMMGIMMQMQAAMEAMEQPAEEVVEAVIADEPADDRPPLRPHRARFDAPPYGIRGPNVVGVRDLLIEATPEGERPLDVSIWYPALNPEGIEESIIYEVNFPDSDFPTFEVAGRAIRDAPDDPSGGPYPLVVYSHPGWSWRQIATYLPEHLASHGYVVIAADHQDNIGTLMQPTYASEISRPQDIKRELDYSESLTEAGEPFEGMIDMERVAITGSSFGGETALEMGGARFNLAKMFDEYCRVHPGEPDDPMNICVELAAHTDEIAQLAGLEAMPEGLWPDWSDPRIDAIIPMAPDVAMFGFDGLQQVDKPMLLMIGSADDLVGPAIDYYSAYETIGSERKIQVVFENGWHGLYGNAIEAMPALLDAGIGFFFVDAVWDLDRAHDLINHFATAFLEAELKGDEAAAAVLAPEAVAFPGVEYQAEGYEAGEAAEPEAQISSESVTEIETLVEQAMADNTLPGVAIGIIKDGKVVYTKGFGEADMVAGKPVTPQSLFSMASISKMLTAAAIMQLVEQGLIDLDAPVTDYLPYFRLDDPRYSEITVRHLLGHTSGLPFFSKETEVRWKAKDYENPDNEEGALERHVRAMNDVKLIADPGGDDTLYSTIGYNVLGAIIAKVSGQSYETYMQENILDPLGMDHSSFLLDDVDPELLTTGYRREVGSSEATPWHFFPFNRQHGPGGGLIANVDDMNKWALAILNGGELNGARIVETETLDEIWTPLSTPGMGGLLQEYGMGWFLAEDKGHRFVWHVGGGPGYMSNLILAPDDDAAVVTMVNSNRDLGDNELWYATDVGIAAMYELLGID
ncbi:MAG: serine hydrolase [Chloroflexota bacterium]|nr:serine hydrolase [Chloroflexota bacterium]